VSQTQEIIAKPGDVGYERDEREPKLKGILRTAGIDNKRIEYNIPRSRRCTSILLKPTAPLDTNLVRLFELKQRKNVSQNRE
jgi:hypothetical protein